MPYKRDAEMRRKSKKDKAEKKEKKEKSEKKEKLWGVQSAVRCFSCSSSIVPCCRK